MDNQPNQAPAPAAKQPAAPRKFVTRRDILIELEAYRPNLRYNLFTARREVYDESADEWQPWTDVHEAALREALEADAGINSEKKVDDALAILFDQQKMDPVRAMLEALPEWDGVERIKDFFPTAVNAPPLHIYAEYARMLFAGALNRVFHPGCKFDELIILADGPRGHQGGGKSTLVKMLNMEDVYYHTVDTIEGQPGMEALQMLWIGELAELAGLKTVKGQEQAKNFLSRTHDHYREPYAKYAIDRPRRCIIIGTTNDAQFLTDRTGNRRYLPVECNLAEGEVERRRQELETLIRQCWSEAVTRYHAGDELFTSCRMRPEFYAQSAQLQQAAMETDWREGLIREYLVKKPLHTIVCVSEVYEHALHINLADKPPDPKASREIGQLIRNTPGWVVLPKVKRFQKYGVQKAFEKVADDTEAAQAPIMIAKADDLPF